MLRFPLWIAVSQNLIKPFDLGICVAFNPRVRHGIEKPLGCGFCERMRLCPGLGIIECYLMRRKLPCATGELRYLGRTPTKNNSSFSVQRKHKCCPRYIPSSIFSSCHLSEIRNACDSSSHRMPAYCSVCN